MQNELLRAPLNRSDKNIDKEIESFTGRLWWYYLFLDCKLQNTFDYMCAYINIFDSSMIL